MFSALCSYNHMERKIHQCGGYTCNNWIVHMKVKELGWGKQMFRGSACSLCKQCSITPFALSLYQLFANGTVVLVHNFLQPHLPSFNSKVTHPCLLRRTEIQSSLKLLRNDLLTFMFLDQWKSFYWQIFTEHGRKGKYPTGVTEIVKDQAT